MRYIMPRRQAGTVYTGTRNFDVKINDGNRRYRKRKLRRRGDDSYYFDRGNNSKYP